MDKTRIWKRTELMIFTTITIISIFPFISTRFFPSMDGASHLYNANIINQLVFHDNQLFDTFFKLNPEPVPNWTSHLLLSLLMTFMPAFLAEKILIILLLTGIPFAFRRLMITISPRNYLFSYLVFPFTHPMFFFFGFFNFCIAILFCLVALTFWIRSVNRKWNVRRILTLILLVAATYFSHIVIFGILMILITLHIFIQTLGTMACRKSTPGEALRHLAKDAGILTLAALVPLSLFVYFFYTRPGTRELNYIAQRDLLEYLRTVRPLISFNPILEGKITSWIYYLILSLFGAGILFYLGNLLKRFFSDVVSDQEHSYRVLPGLNFWWLLLSAGVMLLLYFKLPDAYGTASYTNLRIGLMLFLTTILFISTFRMPQWIGILAAVAALVINYKLLIYYSPILKDLSKLAISCNKASAHVEPNSLVLPIYLMDNWFTGHFVDYLAVDKPVLMVYNYECESGYFPVVWNHATRPNFFVGNPQDTARYLSFEMYNDHKSVPIDYVFTVGQIDSTQGIFFKRLHRIIHHDFIPVYQTDKCILYRNKKVITRAGITEYLHLNKAGLPAPPNSIKLKPK
ncbi:MAG: hypothetical protein PHP04_05950 [Bacteroidales bacterium]|nr:hypothetical protein [Bacteroidales bacterium]